MLQEQELIQAHASEKASSSIVEQYSDREFMVAMLDYFGPVRIIPVIGWLVLFGVVSSSAEQNDLDDTAATLVRWGVPPSTAQITVTEIRAFKIFLEERAASKELTHSSKRSRTVFGTFFLALTLSGHGSFSSMRAALSRVPQAVIKSSSQVGMPSKRKSPIQLPDFFPYLDKVRMELPLVQKHTDTDDLAVLDVLKKLGGAFPETDNSGAEETPAPREDATLELFKQWEKDDPILGPDDAAARQQEGDELMSRIGASRLNFEGRMSLSNWMDDPDEEGGTAKDASQEAAA
ncbi:MAG: hypothetical protein ACR2LA_10290 [Acidimicrobiales bacterium]